MPLDVNCPKCKHVFPVTEARSAIGVQCPGCDTELTAEFRKRSTPVPGQHPYELVVSPGRPVGSPPPLTGKKPLNIDDEEQEMRGGGMGIVVVAGLGALILALAGLGATGYFLFTNLDTSDATINRVSSGSGTKNGTNPRGKPDPRQNGPSFRPSIPNVPSSPFDQTQPKPDTFELKPVTGTLPPITPPTLPANPSNIDLGGKAGAVAVGGGGRYLVMHFPEQGKLGVFDASTARFHTVSADTGDARLAAGLTHVVLYVSEPKIFRVYTLPELKKAYDAGVDLFFGVQSMAMGRRTDGPLLVDAGFGDVRLYDIVGSLKEIEGARGKPGIHSTRDGLRAAPDGLAFTTFDGFANGQKTVLLTSAGRKWQILKDFNQVPFPGPDGNLYGNGVVTDRNGRDQRFGGVGAASNQWFVPAASSPRYFLKVAPTTVNLEGRSTKTIAVTIHADKNGDTPVQGTPALAGLPEFEGIVDPWGNMAKPYDQHFFLIPEAKLFVILAGTKDRLILRNVDLK